MSNKPAFIAAPAQAQPSHAQSSRRSFFVGAVVTTAAATAVVATGSLSSTLASTPEGQALPPAPEKGGGYILSAHVQRYYQTTRT